MVRSVTHDMLPQATANEVSRQQFIVALKQGLNRGLRSSQAALFDNVVAPAYEAEHGHPPRHREEIRAAMQAEPAYQTWSALARAAQEQMWVAVGDSVFRDRFRLARRAAELDSSPQRLGSLTLNPDFEPPRGVTAVDIHLQTGGYALDLGGYDCSAGALYEVGGNLYAFGQGISRTDSKSAHVQRFIAERFPQLQPKRILDMGCSAGSASVPYALAFPDAEVHAIDVGAGMLRYAHARAESLGKRVHFSQQDATATNFPDGHFDLITSSILFHETSAKALPAILRETWRLLAPGGIAVHGDLPPFWAMDEFNQFMLDCETWYNNEPYWGAMREVDQVALSIKAGFAPENVEFCMAPSAYRAAAGHDRSFEAGEFAPGNAWQVLVTRK